MSDQQIVTNIVAKSDFSNLIGDLAKVTGSLTALQEQLIATNKTLAAQVAVMNRSFSETLRSTGQFSTHFVSLTSDVDKFGSQLDKGQIKLGQFFNAYRDQMRSSGGIVRELAKQQVQLQNAVLQPLGRNAQGLMQFNVHVPRGLDEIKNKTAIAQQQLSIMNKLVQEGSGQLINWGKNTQWAGRQLTVGLTVPMLAFGKAASDAFKSADEQLVRLTKVYGGLTATSSQELAKVRKDVTNTARELSKSYGAAFNDTLGLAADIAATGKQGNELLGSIQETTRLSVLGEVDRQEAMKATLSIQTAFKQNTQELSQSINFLNAVENQTSTTLADLVEAIPKAGPVVQGLGGSVKDLALYLTAMREGGINAAEGANALKSGLASLINPTKVATEQFAGFGIDLKGIVTKNAGNLTATLLDLQSALDTLDPLKKQQALEQLFGKFQFARMNALFSNLGKQGSQTLQVLDLMKASSQDLADIAGRELTQVTESASGKYKRAVEGLKADLATIGDKFLEINTRLINFVDGIIKFANRLPGPIKSVLNFLGMITATAGPLIMLTGVLGNFFGYIIKGVYHFKSFFKGAEGWKLLTPEILAAQRAGNLVEATFYNDAKAAAILKQSIMGLTASLTALESKANSAAIKVQPAITTLAGGVVIPGGGPRAVDPRNPYVGAIDTRASSHINPTAGKTSTERSQETIFSVVPGPIPVNRKIGAVPQIMMSGDQPSVPGLSTMHGVSTGIVASEAAKWHSMMGMLSMLSKREVDSVKKEIVNTGTMSQEFMGIYSSLFPTISSLTANAAEQSQAVIRQAKANKISVEAARAEIVRINAELEILTAQATTTLASSMGRTASLTAVPLLGQPVVGPTGKSNMKELFRKNRPEAAIIDRIARILEVRTYGAGYSMETTRPLKRNMGGPVYLSGGSEDPVVPGPNVNKDIVPAILTPGEFVVNKDATAANLPLLQAINNGGSQSVYQNEGTDEALYGLSSKQIRDRYYGRQMAHLTEPVYISSSTDKRAFAMGRFGATNEQTLMPTARVNSSLYAGYHSFVNQEANDGKLNIQKFIDYLSGESVMQRDPRTRAMLPVRHDPLIAYESMMMDLGIPIADRANFARGIDDSIIQKMQIELAAGRTLLADSIKPGDGRARFGMVGDVIEERVRHTGDPEILRKFRELKQPGDFRYQRPGKSSSQRKFKKEDSRISSIIASVIAKKRMPKVTEAVQNLFPNIRLKTPPADPNARVQLRPGKHSGSRLAPLPRNTGGVISLNSGGMVPGSNAAPIFSAVPAQHFGLGGIVKNILQWLVGKKGPSQILPKSNSRRNSISPALPVFEDMSAMPLLGQEGALEYYLANNGAKQIGTSIPQAPVSKSRSVGAKVIRGAGFIGGWPLAQMAVNKLGIPDPMGMTSMMGMAAINKGAANAASVLTKQSGNSSVLGKFGSALTKEGTALGKFTGAFVKFGTVASRFSGPLTIAVTALQIYGKVQENTRKQQEKASFSLSMNAEKAKEAGITFTDLGKRVAETTNKFKDYKAAAEFNYAQSTQASGTGGLKITVADLAAEEKRVKKEMPKYVEAFKDKDINTVISDAIALKGQMMALGDKSEAEVDKTIYAIVKAAQGGQAALRVISNDTYSGIDNTQKGLSQITKNVLKIYRDLETYGTKSGVDAINNLWQAMDKNPGLTDTLKEYDELIAKLEKSGYLSEKSLGSDFIKQLEVSAPQTAALMKQITNETDSVVSATDKWKIATSGLITDYATIQQLTREEARKLAEFAVEAQGGINQVMAKMYGPQQKRLVELTEAYNRASKAAKAESVSQQKKNADRLKQIDAEIKKIQDLADARVKAIEEANTAEDYNLQIKKKQLEYQDAIATGNTSAAAQAQLDLQRLVSGRQSDLAVKSIQDRAKKDIAPLNKEKERISNASEAKQWATALAAESASTYKTAMDDLSLKLQTANTGMLNAFYKWAKGENLTAAELKQLKVDYEKLKGKTTMTPEQILQSIQTSFKDFQLTNPQLYSDTIEIFTSGRGAIPSNYGKSFPVRGTADYKEKDGKYYKTADGKTTEITKKQYEVQTSEPLRPNSKTQIYPNPEFPHGTVLNSINLPIGYAKQFNGLWYFDSGQVTTDQQGKNVVGIWAGKDYTGRSRAYSGGGEVKYFEPGGDVRGPGTGTSDSIPAMLSNGEYVIRASAVEKYGVPFFDAANAQKLAGGGMAKRKKNNTIYIDPEYWDSDEYGDYQSDTTKYPITKNQMVNLKAALSYMKKETGVNFKIVGNNASQDLLKKAINIRMYNKLSNSMKAGYSDGERVHIGNVDTLNRFTLGRSGSTTTIAHELLHHMGRDHDCDDYKPGGGHTKNPFDLMFPVGLPFQNMSKDSINMVKKYAQKLATGGSVEGGGKKLNAYQKFMFDTADSSGWIDKLFGIDKIFRLLGGDITPGNVASSALSILGGGTATTVGKFEALNIMRKGIHKSPNPNLVDDLKHPLQYKAEKEQTLGNFTHFSIDPAYQGKNPRFGFNEYQPKLDRKAIIAILKSRGFASSTQMQKYGVNNGLYKVKWNHDPIQDAISDGFIGTKFLIGMKNFEDYSKNAQFAPFFTGIKRHPLGKIEKRDPNKASELMKALYALPNKVNQIKNQAKVNSMIKNGMWHGSQPQGLRGEEYLQGKNILDGAETHDPFYGMGFFGTTSKSEADLYASGYNSLNNWGESFGSLNQITKAPKGKYVDFTRGTNSIKWQNYELAKALGIKKNEYLGQYMKENLGDVMNSKGMTGAIMNRINAGRAPKDIQDAKWLGWNNPAGVHTIEKYRAGGMANIPKFDDGINMVPADMLAMIHKNEAVIPANMNPYNPNASSNNLGGDRVYTIAPVINAAAGMDENMIADVATRKVLQAMQNLDRLNTSKLGVSRVVNPRGEIMQ